MPVQFLVTFPFSSSSCKKFIEKLTSTEYLFYNISLLRENASILKRSFSVLIITMVIGKDYTQQTFTKEYLLSLLKIIEKYIECEHDWRGKDEKLGWIHASAHLADTLGAIAGHPNSEKLIRQKSLALVKNLYLKTERINFTHNEHKRMLKAIFSII